MKTTAEERKKAVWTARAILEDGPADEFIDGDVLLLCRTILDCQSAFVRMAPVYSAAPRVVRPDGQFTFGGVEWREFADAVRAAREQEEQT